MKIDGRRVRDLRIGKSWSQEKLSQISRLNLRTIQRIESNNVASLGARRSIAAALDVVPSALDPVATVTPIVRGSASVIVGVYVIWTAVSLGLAVLDVIYASRLLGSVSPSTATAIYADVADFLLGVGVVTMPVFAAAVYASWTVRAARAWIASSMAVKLVVSILVLLLLPKVWPHSIEWLSHGVGALIRLAMHTAATVCAFVGWTKVHRAGGRRSETSAQFA